MVRMLMLLEQLRTVTPPTESKPLMCEEEKKAFDAVTKALDTYIDVHNKCAMSRGLDNMLDMKDPYYMLGVTYVTDAVEECVHHLGAAKHMIEDTKIFRNAVDEACEEHHTTVGELAFYAVTKRITSGMMADLFKKLFS